MQALHAAQDYGQQIAYLLIINLSGRPLALPSDDDPKTWPPRIAEVPVWPVRCVQVEPAGLAELSRVWADGGSVVALERESERDVCMTVLAAGLRDAYEERLAAA